MREVTFGTGRKALSFGRQKLNLHPAGQIGGRQDGIGGGHRGAADTGLRGPLSRRCRARRRGARAPRRLRRPDRGGPGDAHRRARSDRVRLRARSRRQPHRARALRRRGRLIFAPSSSRHSRFNPWRKHETRIDALRARARARAHIRARGHQRRRHRIGHGAGGIARHPRKEHVRADAHDDRRAEGQLHRARRREQPQRSQQGRPPSHLREQGRRDRRLDHDAGVAGGAGSRGRDADPDHHDGTDAIRAGQGGLGISDAAKHRHHELGT